MIGVQRVLVAVADSPSGLAAMRTATAVAGELRAELRAVHVLTDGELVAALAGTGGRNDLVRRQGSAAIAVLHHAAELATRAGVAVTTKQLVGDVARCVLEEAQRWNADLIVVGRTTRRGAGQPFVGSDVQAIMEFAECPILVVPA